MDVSYNVENWPCIIWKIAKFYTVREADTGTFHLGVFCNNDKDNKLVLQMVGSENMYDDCYKLYCYYRGGESPYLVKAFTVIVYVKDLFGNANFYQLNHSPNVGRHCTDSFFKQPLWSVKRSDLISKSRVLQESGYVTIICKFLPRFEEGIECYYSVPKENASTQTFSDHQCLESLAQDFHSYLINDVDPDVVLKCGDETFPFHRSILSARSSVFAAMFRNEMAENLEGVVDVEDMDPADLKGFLQYVSFGSLPTLNKDNAPKLYFAGSKYAVDALKEKCANFMMDNITEDDALSLLVLADAHDDEIFKSHVVSFITTTDEVLTKSEWFQFSAEHSRLSCEVYHVYVSNICEM